MQNIRKRNRQSLIALLSGVSVCMCVKMKVLELLMKCWRLVSGVCLFANHLVYLLLELLGRDAVNVLGQSLVPVFKI